MDSTSTRTRTCTYPHTPEEFARLLDEAKVRAVQARTEAIALFWQGVIAAARRAWPRPEPVPRRMRIRFG